MSSEICATLTPSKAGSISLAMFLVAGSAHACWTRAQLKPIFGNSPRRSRAGTCTASWRAPPSITPAPRAYTGSIPCALNQGAPSQAAAIIATLSSTGVAAGTAKRRQVLSTPEDSATSDMKPM